MAHIPLLKELLQASAYPVFLFTTNNGITNLEGGFKNHLLVSDSENSLPLSALHYKHETDLFGYFAYDLKNQLHGIASKGKKHIDAPDFQLFRANIKKSWESLELYEEDIALKEKQPYFYLDTTREEYIKKVTFIKDRIRDGAFYELNYCIGYHASDFLLNPIALFLRLNMASPMPFASLHKAGSYYIISASPERFIKKSGNKIICQPIKGTSMRGKTVQEDQNLIHQLQHSEKEQAENVMIVDLTRNDLAQSCQPGSVLVEELCKIHTFKRIHQMVSTVSGTLKDNVSGFAAWLKAFPMGSMTGAPKLEVMKYIDQLENYQRGVFSGSVFYMEPNGDIDSNVLIRTIIIDTKTRKASFYVGSAITLDAVPEQEWEECLTKAEPFLQLFGINKG